jgi:gliding motility-associated-like protein
MLFLPVLIIALVTHAAAQSDLGDPVYTFNFGSGPNPGPPLGLNSQGTPYTTMAYTTGCPNDGQYTIANCLTDSNNCHPQTWETLDTDHTGNPYGYMMIINANLQPSVFFTAPVDVRYLCPNTTYRFSAYITNLIQQAAQAGTIEPSITFTVTTTDGTVLATNSTGSIAPHDPDSPPWNLYSVKFTTPVNLTSVIVTMTNNAPGGNGNDLALDDIEVRAYGPTISTPAFSIGSGPSSLCEGKSATYRLSTHIQPNVFTNPAFQWQENINKAGWTDLPNETVQILNINTEFNPANTPGTYQYRLGVAEAANINSPLCRIYSRATTITVNPLPIVTGVLPAQSECSGGVLTLSASGGTSYIWTGPNMQPTTNNPLVIPHLTTANSGTYQVIVSNQYECAAAPVSTIVTVFPKTHITATGGTTVCEGIPVQLSVSGAVTYTWSPGKSLSDSTSANPIATPTDTTLYTVIGTDANGCQDTATVKINIHKKPVANAGPNRYTYEGQSIQLLATAKYASTYSWSPTTGLSNPTILRPVATPSSDITYTLTAISPYDCSVATSSVFVRVYKRITIPNTFSPNNDGINDTWDINALITYPESVMLIFNRYGQQIFKSIGYSKPWDGTYNGKPVPSGTYYYVLDLKDKKPVIAGYVMVVR